MDLRIGDIKSTLSKYIQEETSPSILKLIEIKLFFYIRMRFCGTDFRKENEMVDLIVNIQLKLHPEQNVAIDKAYKSQKALIRKNLLAEIQKM